MVNTSDLNRRFRAVFAGATPTVAIRAPGRVNLIGEHVDYCDGLVLPIAMTQSLHVLAGPSNDEVIEVHSSGFDQAVRFPASNPGPPGEPAWSNYVRGVAALLIKEGIKLKGGRLLIHSEVPIGGGVSSSAALEVGTALALLALAGRTMEPVPLALLARQAEHQYAGSPCGIMDQFICMLGRADHALLLDCRSQQYEQLPLRLDGAVLMVMNTQVKHAIGSSEYPVRQRQCREGLALLNKRDPRVRSLRDVTPRMLEAARQEMDSLTFDRCWHVVTEIERTLQAADALRANDLGEFGRLMFGSHQSLSGKYAVSCPELDALVEMARRIEGVYGARMTGGGFGGCAIALVRQAAEAAWRCALEEQYNPRFEKPAIVYTTRAENGAEVRKL